MPGGWQIFNPGYVANRLAALPVQDVEGIAEAIELLLEDPYDPPGLTAHMMRGNNPKNVYVAYLPDHWYLTYTVHPGGVPPIGGRLIWVRALRRREI